MNIGIIGVGGVGGFLGCKLAKRYENDKINHVCFLARGEHLEKIKKNGLALMVNKTNKIEARPYLASDDVKDFPVLDVCIICVKAYDLNNVIKNLECKITEKTEIIPLLNGIDIPERIHKIIPKAKVYPSCIYIGSHIKEPGVIEHVGGAAKVVCGPEKGSNVKEIPKFVKLFNESGIDYLWTQNNLQEIWKKFMLVDSYAIVTAYYNKTMGEVYNTPALKEKVLKIAKLLRELALRKNIDLSEDSPKNAIDVVKDYPYELKTSFQRDFECKDKPCEKETFVYTIINMAQEYGIDTQFIKDIIKDDYKN